MSEYSPAQKKVIARITAIGREVGASPKEIKAALETGRVESNFQNLPGGDADSQGWRQERASLYKDPQNLDASIRRFYKETAAARSKYGSAGELAAAVQRPAAQYRGRYQEHSSEADALLGRVGRNPQAASPSTSSGGSVSTTTTSQVPDPAAFRKAQGQQLLAKMFAKQKRGGALLSSGVLSTQDPDPSQFLKTVRSTSSRALPSPMAPLQNGKSSRGKAKSGGVTVAAGADRRGVSIQKPILGFLHELAGAQGRSVTVTTGTNHNQMTTSGNVSDHWDGNAADLGMGGDARQSPAVDQKGTLTAAHALQVASAQAGKPLSFKQAYAMAHQGGLWNFETPKGRVQIIWKTMTGGDHFNHVHVGVNPHR